MEEAIRYVVADKHGLCPDPSRWQYNTQGVPSRYVKDVWELVKHKGALCHELLAIAKDVERVIIVGGRPCQDLTTMNELGGILGVAGARSRHFHIFPVLLSVLKAVKSSLTFFVTVENAGSMLDIHRKYMREALDLPLVASKAINSGEWGHVRRNRIFLSNTLQACKPEQQPAPWDEGYVLAKCWQGHRLMPWLRSRGRTEAGHVILTTGAYHPHNLLYRAAHFGGLDALEKLWDVHTDLPAIRWQDFMDPAAFQAMQTLLAWPIKDRLFPNEDEDKAAKVLADFYATAPEGIPFRPPNLAEKQRESELARFYDEVHGAKALMDDRMLTDLIGNFFKPSALRAAMTGQNGKALADFLEGSRANMATPRPVSPNQMAQNFNSHLVKVRALLAEALAQASGPRKDKLSVYARKYLVTAPTPLPKYDDTFLQVVRMHHLQRAPTIQAYRPLQPKQVPSLLLPCMVDTAESVDHAPAWQASAHYPLLTHLMQKGKRRIVDIDPDAHEWLRGT